MKLKILYLFFIGFLSFYSNAQVTEINRPVLANSQSLLNDSLKNNSRDDLPKLSIQGSKLNSKDETLYQQPKLAVSEVVEIGASKEIIHPKR